MIPILDNTEAPPFILAIEAEASPFQYTQPVLLTATGFRTMRAVGKDVQSMMIEKLHWSTTGEGRGLGADIATDEPSHIHLPRRRRRVGSINGGTSTPVGAHIGDGSYDGQAQLATEEA